ncbi:adenosine deaminase, tRNA-specific 3, partial [Rhizophlyctis rosea]
MSTIKEDTVPSIEQVHSDERTRGLETVDMYITSIDAKNASKLMKLASKAHPLTGFDHVKRIRRTQTPTGIILDFILSPVSTAIESDLTTFLQQSLDIPCPSLSIIAVPKHAPITREQFSAWKNLWPISFHELTTHKLEVLGDEKIRVASGWMEAAIGEGRKGKDAGKFPNGGVAVDPTANTLIASSGDTRKTHPLQHATMNLIALVAEQELARRAKAESGTEVSESQSTELPIAGTKRKSVDEESIQDPSMKGYLCTGLDIYLMREPCVMCSMALVHSR